MPPVRLRSSRRAIARRTFVDVLPTSPHCLKTSYVACSLKLAELCRTSREATAKFRGADGRPIWRSTKQTDHRKAIAVARKWEQAARLAASSELTQAASIRLLDELMETTIGENFNVRSVESYFAEWFKGKNATGTSPGTLTRYRPVLDGFIASLSEQRRRASVSSITALEVERFRDGELEGGKTPGTANFAVKVLRAVFNTARRRGLSPTNPAEAIELLNEIGEERMPFTDDQVKALLGVADNEWQGMILLGYHSGICLGDAAHLTRGNLDLLTRVLVFRAGKTVRRKKGRDKETVVYMHPDLAAYFKSLPASDDPNAPVFPNLYGKKSGSHGGLSNAFNRLMERADIRVPLGSEKRGKGRRFKALGFHSLRHSFISRLANAEVPADVRKQLVGHSSDDIHRRYVHLDLSLQTKAIAGLSSLLPAPTKRSKNRRQRARLAASGTVSQSSSVLA
jgi:integrase